MTDIKMGSRIMEMRRARKLTQEQLADMLGVSAPAVSKWETDSSCPDIAMLCPLARALGTDVDTLLSYEETLTEEKQGQYMTEIIGMVREGKGAEAEERLEQLLHNYPSSASLKFSAIAVYSLFEMNSPSDARAGETVQDGKAVQAGETVQGGKAVQAGETVQGEKAVQAGETVQDGKAAQDRERWKKRKKELAGAIYAAGESPYYLPAISMLITLELADNHLDRAEMLLEKTLVNTADFTLHWVQLYQKKGEYEKALETVQQNLYKRVNDIQTCLMIMLGDNMGFDREKSLEICDIFRRQEELFGVGGGMGAGVIAEVYLRLGRKQEALDYLEEFMERLIRGVNLPNQTLFYPAFSAEKMQLQPCVEIRQSVLKGMEQDDCLSELRREERFQSMMKRLRETM